MTEQEIGIKIVSDLADTTKKFLLRTINGETLKEPYEQLMKTLDANYLEYCNYLEKLRYTLRLIFGLNVNIGIGTVSIDLDKEDNDETDDVERTI